MPTKTLFNGTRTFDARPDRIDFRDLPYRARLVSLPMKYPSDQLIEEWFPIYRASDMVLDQGDEGSCTGFGLAGVVNYLRWELANATAIEGGEKPAPKPDGRVSARMLYQNARLYDEWKGEDYEGSSCRGAMKGFHKHGVCAEQYWPYLEKRNKPGLPREGWDASAPQTPLGAYFRIDGKSIVDMQSAIYETHAIYVSADVHDGWVRVGNNRKSIDDALIGPPNKPNDVGGHAFAMVGYTSRGFIVQNSWGPDWGFHGFAVLPYEDWTRHGTDAWALALGAPMEVSFPPIKPKKGAKPQTASPFRSPKMRTDLSLDERMRARSMQRDDVAKDTSAVSPWINGEEAHRTIFIGHNGRAERELVAANSGDDAVVSVVRECVATAADRGYSHVAIYAHGGLNSRSEGLDRARVLGPWLEANDIMPIFVVWQTGFFESAADILKGAVEKIGVPAGADKGWLRSKIDEIKDRAFEVFARDAGVKAIWENMKNRADGASRSGGGLMTAATELRSAIGELSKAQRPEIHLVGHSAGAIMQGHFLSAMKARSLQASSVHLWAPACTVEFATAKYGQAFANKVADPTTTFIDVLSDDNELTDPCVPVLYSKSLLYLVSRALEPDHKTPILGLQKVWPRWSVGADFMPGYQKILADWQADSEGVVLQSVTETEVPINDEPDKDETIDAGHGSFDNNLEVVNRAIKLITGKKTLRMPVTDLRGF
ncbi:C1 family peptidase [Bradyrhizobium sp. Arg68]|uniref:C1 family peptidase n=1 Tax=Bradyrhizobium ivorense TaxID=2511166 RepID=UPI001E55AD18|nr:C1 family peptidase [Bradyrhizobium ivorense]MCC8937416.1 C1 family peptidase [Bradyrhizobium ivorense]